MLTTPMKGVLDDFGITMDAVKAFQESGAPLITQAFEETIKSERINAGAYNPIGRSRIRKIDSNTYSLYKNGTFVGWIKRSLQPA